MYLALRMYRHATEQAPGALPGADALVAPDRFVLYARVGGLASSPSSPAAARAAAPADFDQLEVAWRRSGVRAFVSVPRFQPRPLHFPFLPLFRATAWVERALETLDKYQPAEIDLWGAKDVGKPGPADVVRRMGRSLSTLAEKGAVDAVDAALAGEGPAAPAPAPVPVLQLAPSGSGS
eukprot:tig00000139_g8296.t1